MSLMSTDKFWLITLKSKSTCGTNTTNAYAKLQNNPKNIFVVIVLTTLHSAGGMKA